MHADGIRDGENQKTAGDSIQNQSSSTSAAQMSESSPRAVAQLKFQALANDSAQAHQAIQRQAKVDDHTTTRQPSILQKNKGNITGDTVQRVPIHGGIPGRTTATGTLYKPDRTSSNRVLLANTRIIFDPNDRKMPKLGIYAKTPVLIRILHVVDASGQVVTGNTIITNQPYFRADKIHEVANMGDPIPKTALKPNSTKHSPSMLRLLLEGSEDEEEKENRLKNWVDGVTTAGAATPAPVTSEEEASSPSALPYSKPEFPGTQNPLDYTPLKPLEEKKLEAPSKKGSFSREEDGFDIL